MEDNGRSERRLGSDLPEDVFRLGAAGQCEVYAVAYGEIARYLEYPDIVCAARKSEVSRRYSPARELIQARDEIQPGEISGPGIQESASGYWRPSGGIVIRYGQIAFGLG